MLRSLLLTHSLPCSPWRKALSLPPRWHTFGLSEFWSYTALSFLPRCPSKESSDVWIFHVVIRVSSSWSPRRIGHYSVRLRNLSIVCVAILYKLYANATKVQRIFSMKPLCKLGGMIFFNTYVLIFLPIIFWEEYTYFCELEGCFRYRIVSSATVFVETFSLWFSRGAMTSIHDFGAVVVPRQYTRFLMHGSSDGRYVVFLFMDVWLYRYQ